MMDRAKSGAGSSSSSSNNGIGSSSSSGIGSSRPGSPEHVVWLEEGEDSPLWPMPGDSEVAGHAQYLGGVLAQGPPADEADDGGYSVRDGDGDGSGSPQLVRRAVRSPQIDVAAAQAGGEAQRRHAASGTAVAEREEEGQRPAASVPTSTSLMEQQISMMQGQAHAKEAVAASEATGADPGAGSRGGGGLVGKVWGFIVGLVARPSTPAGPKEAAQAQGQEGGQGPASSREAGGQGEAARAGREEAQEAPQAGAKKHPWWSVERWFGSKSSVDEDEGAGGGRAAKSAEFEGERPLEAIVIPADLPIEAIAREVARLKEESWRDKDSRVSSLWMAAVERNDRSWYLLLAILLSVVVGLLGAVFYRIGALEGDPGGLDPEAAAAAGVTGMMMVAGGGVDALGDLLTKLGGP